MAKHFIVQSYRPENWALRPGFVTSGRPTIYVQSPDGEVLHRQDDYEGGIGALSVALERACQLRRRNPLYRPQLDPDLRQWFWPWRGFELRPSWLLLVVGLVLLLTLWKGKR
ncbi:MAG: hypothetical protein KatS3mg105_4886 [Gemmatales bacterium]|nr:MAG: hypothetical protein KatS3mg105_4886 [Gemmatales bacterium]